MKKEIETMSDIQEMVNQFYSKVRADEMLKDIFNNRIQNRWPQHLEKMYRFWQTVLLEEHTYFGSPFLPHAKLPVEKKHFERWVNLFNETIDGLFEGEKAYRAKKQGQIMAELFLSKIDYYKNNSATPLI